MSNRYLTKSRFKTGHECPTKLHYLDNPQFANNKLDDTFLEALADGGFQVGELAKLYYPGGVEITERDHQKAADLTANLLKQPNAVIYEAALLFDNLFVKVDILIKKGNSVRLLEVKAKSWRDGDSFFTKKGGLASEWGPYIADIAFQRHVAMKAFPEFRYACALYLANKDKVATVDGLHQRFFLVQKDGRTSVEVLPGTTKETLGDCLLIEVPADIAIETFINQEFDGRTFDGYVQFLSDLARSGDFSKPRLTRACGACEYRVSPDELDGKESGFLKCWTTETNCSAQDLREPLIFDIWNLHYTKKDRLIADRRYFARDVAEDDIDPEEDTSTELTAKQRQWLQIQYLQAARTQHYFDADHFSDRARIENWRPPYHFIDFETITSAIPFHKGIRPYETIAFQFSHHLIDCSGNLTHQAQYINVAPGAFPNFDFIRALRATLGTDDGTVFRYAAHENTVLNHIRLQLLDSSERDRDELVGFIDSLTVRRESNRIVHEGQRKMVDMLELVKRLYYSPFMGGSNSIKKVLPAVLRESELLKARYSKPIYGAAAGIKSHNFKDKIWIKEVNGVVEDPYKSLDPIFKDYTPEQLAQIDRLFDDDEIKEGGAASTAYARMQFTRMSDQERDEIARALLRYCELDTLAMVMIWEYWTGELIKKAKKAA